METATRGNSSTWFQEEKRPISMSYESMFIAVRQNTKVYICAAEFQGQSKLRRIVEDRELPNLKWKEKNKLADIPHP